MRGLSQVGLVRRFFTSSHPVCSLFATIVALVWVGVIGCAALIVVLFVSFGEYIHRVTVLSFHKVLQTAAVFKLR